MYIKLKLDTPLEFSKYVSNKAGVCELEFTNDSMTMKFISTNSNIIDSFTLTKN
jgi:hypothetical protein